MEILTSQKLHAPLLADYYTRNSERFAPWHPRVSADHNSESSWVRRLQERERDFQEGRSAHFIGLKDNRVAGSCSLTSIVYSPAYYCYMGYSVDADHEGSGVMTQIVRHAIAYAFTNLRLNRISANYMPVNTRSERLLKKLGFHREGYAKRYLHINGRWEDHVLTSLLNPKAPDEK